MQDSTSISARRGAVARAWDLRRGAVVVPAGAPVPIDGTDQYHDFWSHPEFRYLTGASVAQGVVVFDPGEGWTLFAPVASLDDRVWVGDGVALEALRAESAIDRVRPLADLASWLEARRGEPLALLGNNDLAQRPGAYGLQSWTALEMLPDAELSERLSATLSELRRISKPAPGVKEEGAPWPLCGWARMSTLAEPVRQPNWSTMRLERAAGRLAAGTRLRSSAAMRVKVALV